MIVIDAAQFYMASILGIERLMSVRQSFQIESLVRKCLPHKLYHCLEMTTIDGPLLVCATCDTSWNSGDTKWASNEQG